MLLPLKQEGKSSVPHLIAELKVTLGYWIQDWHRAGVARFKAVCTHTKMCTHIQAVTSWGCRTGSNNDQQNRKFKYLQIYIYKYMNINRSQHRKLQYKFQFKYNPNINFPCIDSIHFADPPCILFCIQILHHDVLTQSASALTVSVISASRKGEVIPSHGFCNICV